jgi:hypothetical protein
MDRRILVFDRTPIARILSCAAVFGSAALLFGYLAQPPAEIDALPLAGFATLVLGTLAAAVIQYGDRIYLSEEGLMYENRLMALLGRRGRWMQWDDVVEVREVKGRVLVLLSRDGRRVLVDAILGYPIARNEILRRASRAIFSGTLAPDS